METLPHILESKIVSQNAKISFDTNSFYATETDDDKSTKFIVEKVEENSSIADISIGEGRCMVYGLYQTVLKPTGTWPTKCVMKARAVGPWWRDRTKKIDEDVDEDLWVHEIQNWQNLEKKT